MLLCLKSYKCCQTLNATFSSVLVEEWRHFFWPFPDVCGLSLGLVVTRQMPSPWSNNQVLSFLKMCTIRFYRAMLLIARTMLSQDVHLSVCLSVTPRYCVKTSKYINIIILFSPSDNHPFQFFCSRMLWQYSDGDLQKGRRMQEVCEKNAIFDQYLALSRKSYEIGQQLPWNANRKAYTGFRVVPCLMILSDI